MVPSSLKDAAVVSRSASSSRDLVGVARPQLGSRRGEYDGDGGEPGAEGLVVWIERSSRRAAGVEEVKVAVVGHGMDPRRHPSPTWTERDQVGDGATTSSGG